MKNYVRTSSGDIFTYNEKVERYMRKGVMIYGTEDCVERCGDTFNELLLAGDMIEFLCDDKVVRKYVMEKEVRLWHETPIELATIWFRVGDDYICVVKGGKLK